MFDTSAFSFSGDEPEILRQLERESTMLLQKAKIIDSRWRRMKNLPPLPAENEKGIADPENNRPPTIESLTLERMDLLSRMKEQEADLLAMEYEAEMKKSEASLAGGNSEPLTFEGLFYDSGQIELALQLLREKKIIGSDNHIPKNPRYGYKSMISAWVYFLRDNSIIQQFNNTKTAELIASKFSLKSFSASTLDMSTVKRNQSFNKWVSEFRVKAKSIFLIK